MGTDRRDAVPPSGSFANFDVLVEGWYVLARSRDIKRNGVISTDRLGKRVALYRDNGGVLHATTGRCPHLGADLGQGRVENDMVVCSFHAWSFDSTGVCRSAPGQDELPARSLRVYPVRERWGLVFVYAGETPAYDLPDVPDGGDYMVVRAPPQVMKCHPHLALCNPLDAVHFSPLHGVEHVEPAVVGQPDEFRVTLDAAIAPRTGILRRIAGSDRAPAVVRFTTIGPSLTWYTMKSPYRMHVLFTGLPTRDGRCRTQTVAFLPRNLVESARGLVPSWSIVANDRKMLERLQFRPDFTASDEGVARYAELIDNLPVAVANFRSA